MFKIRKPILSHAHAHFIPPTTGAMVFSVSPWSVQSPIIWSECGRLCRPLNIMLLAAAIVATDGSLYHTQHQHFQILGEMRLYLFWIYLLVAEYHNA